MPDQPMQPGDHQTALPQGFAGADQGASLALSQYAARTAQSDAMQAAPSSHLKKLGIATLEGIENITQGFVNTIKQEGIGGMVENVALSAGLGFGLKMLLPETGPVGTVAGLIIGGYFMTQQAKPIYEAYKGAWNATTMGELHNAGSQLGDAGG